MDYESLKEHWSEVEDRDGVRLSWNVFPTSRMVGCISYFHQDSNTDTGIGGISSRGPNRSPLHTSERKARHSLVAIRTRDMQAALSLRSESLLVSLGQTLEYCDLRSKRQTPEHTHR